jgi:uncharacterized membrane protein
VDLKTKIITFLAGLFSKEVVVVLLAALPIFELRLSIPIAMLKFNMPAYKAFLLSILGNMLPVIPFLLFLRWAVVRLEHLHFVGKFLMWWFKRAEAKSKAIKTYGFWGLVIFIAIPLPGTGAWTGCVVATLFNFKLVRATMACFLGVLGAGIIVLGLCGGIAQILPFLSK